MLAIYFDVGPGDSRKKWKAHLHDPRVVSYWDEGAVVGRKLAESPQWTEPFPYVWDAWILYDATSKWPGSLPGALDSGGPVEDRIEELRAALAKAGVPPATGGR